MDFVRGKHKTLQEVSGRACGWDIGCDAQIELWFLKCGGLSVAEDVQHAQSERAWWAPLSVKMFIYTPSLEVSAQARKPNVLALNM